MRARQGWRAVAAAAVLVAAGCGVPAKAKSAGGAPAGAPGAVPADPGAAIAAAKAKLGTESARFRESTGQASLDFAGVVNAQTKNWEITGQDYVMRRVGTSVYLRAGGQKLDGLLLPAPAAKHLAAGGWVRTRLPNYHDTSALYNDNFPWSMAAPATRADHLARTSDGSYTGTETVDATKLGVPTGAPKTLKVATSLDDRGRLTRVVVYIDPPANTESTELTYSDYGVRADVTAPAAADTVDVENPAFLGMVLPY